MLGKIVCPPSGSEAELGILSYRSYTYTMIYYTVLYYTIPYHTISYYIILVVARVSTVWREGAARHAALWQDGSYVIGWLYCHFNNLHFKIQVETKLVLYCLKYKQGI